MRLSISRISEPENLQQSKSTHSYHSLGIFRIDIYSLVTRSLLTQISSQKTKPSLWSECSDQKRSLSNLWENLIRSLYMGSPHPNWYTHIWRGETRTSSVRSFRSLVWVTRQMEMADNRSDIVRYTSDTNRDGILSTANLRLWRLVSTTATKNTYTHRLSLVVYDRDSMDTTLDLNIFKISLSNKMPLKPRNTSKTTISITDQWWICECWSKYSYYVTYCHMGCGKMNMTDGKGNLIPKK